MQQASEIIIHDRARILAVNLPYLYELLDQYFKKYDELAELARHALINYHKALDIIINDSDKENNSLEKLRIEKDLTQKAAEQELAMVETLPEVQILKRRIESFMNEG